jgi:DNA-binding LacI/PurR family transcriptional regulator
MSATLQEIAKQLDVSTATVSRVLNGKEGVSAKTRKRVLEVAATLNVMATPAARNLAKAHNLAVAFVIRRPAIPLADNAFYDRVMRGAERELEKHGYHLVSITIDEQPGEPVNLPPSLDKKRLDGLLIVGPELSEPMMAALTTFGRPSVLVANKHLHVNVDSVTSANREGGDAITTHLIEHGHQHIICLSGPQAWSPVGDRVDGYKDAMRRHDLQSKVIYRSDFLTVEIGYDAMQEALREHPEVTAVFATNDTMAIGAMRAARDMNCKVPDDLAIVGFDNIFWAENTDPPLTTVYIHKEEIGMLAARRLLEILHKGPQIPVDIRVKNELVIRQSCGCRVNEKRS